jgi:hypothetical protein
MQHSPDARSTAVAARTTKSGPRSSGRTLIACLAPVAQLQQQLLPKSELCLMLTVLMRQRRMSIAWFARRGIV